MEKALYPITYDHSMKISLAKGNHKLGKRIWNFNTLPGDEPLRNNTKGLLTNVRGTCGGCCEGCKGACYAIRDGKFHSNSCIPAWSKNTLIARHDPDKMFNQVATELNKHKAKVMRWHSSGEIINYDYLLHMVKLAVQMPMVQFYFYTKRFELIDRYLKEFKKFPKNLVANISVWHDNANGYNFGKCNQFIYDDGTDPEIAKMRHCPAVDKKGNSTGITCEECGWCFKGNFGRKTAVYDH